MSYSTGIPRTAGIHFHASSGASPPQSLSFAFSLIASISIRASFSRAPAATSCRGPAPLEWSGGRHIPWGSNQTNSQRMQTSRLWASCSPGMGTSTIRPLQAGQLRKRGCPPVCARCQRRFTKGAGIFLRSRPRPTARPWQDGQIQKTPGPLGPLSGGPGTLDRQTYDLSLFPGYVTGVSPAEFLSLGGVQNGGIAKQTVVGHRGLARLQRAQEGFELAPGAEMILGAVERQGFVPCPAARRDLHRGFLIIEQLQGRFPAIGITDAQGIPGAGAFVCGRHRFALHELVHQVQQISPVAFRVPAGRGGHAFRTGNARRQEKLGEIADETGHLQWRAPRDKAGA